MKKLVILFCIVITSCVNSSTRSKHAFFKGTFLKIEKRVIITACNPKNDKQCITKEYNSSASSFLIKNKKDKSYLLTAAHVCKTDYGSLIFLPKFQVKEEFYGLNFKMQKFKYKVHSIDQKNDLCIVTSDRIDAKPYKIAKSYPALGDVVYNIAAPLGIFEKGIVPLFSGRFSGSAYDRALYTLPAVGGSSGSPVLNKKGQVIGLVSAVTIKFNQIVISPTLEQIRKIVKDAKL